MDYTKINRIIDDSGFKRAFVAKRLGMSDTMLWSRTHGRSKWKPEEMARFCEMFKLSRRDGAAIFLP